MKNHTCKKLVSLICAVLLLAAAIVPAYADDDSISVNSTPVTDGKTCSSCGLNAMVATGGTRASVTKVQVSSCYKTNYVTMVHYHTVTTYYASYQCTNCGSWGEMVTGKTSECPIT